MRRNLNVAMVYASLIYAGVLAASGANADTVTPFALTDFTFSDGATAAGSVSIDTTAGTVESVDITYKHGSSLLTFNTVGQAVFNNSLYDVFSYDTAGDTFLIGVEGNNIVGYSGGPVCSLSQICTTASAGGRYGYEMPAGGAVNGIETGSLTPVVPLPTTLWLMMSGLGGLAAFARKRRHKSPQGHMKSELGCVSYQPAVP